MQARSSALSTAFARGSNGGLIMGVTTSVSDHRELIVALAAQHRCLRSIPTVRLSPTAA